MSLLQRSEPDESPKPHHRRIAVGIDLGTTHSLVAAVRSSSAECLPDEQGRVLLPSIVHYAPGGAVEGGYEATLSRPANVVSERPRPMLAWGPFRVGRQGRV